MFPIRGAADVAKVDIGQDGAGVSRKQLLLE
jgi:hypothetical protein